MHNYFWVEKLYVSQYALAIKRSDLGTSQNSLKGVIQIVSFLFQLLGCVENNMFRKEESDHKLRTLNTKWPRRANLAKQNCAVNISSSWYVGCHGEKLPIAESDAFSLKWNSSRSRCDLTVRHMRQFHLTLVIVTMNTIPFSSSILY